MRIRCLIHLPQFCRSHYIKLFFRNKMSGVSLNNITLCILLSVNNIVQFFYRFLWLWFHDTAVVLLTEHFSLCLTKPVFYLSCIKCVFLTKPKTNLKEKLACYFDAREKGENIVQKTVMDIMYIFIIVLYCSYLLEARDIVQ